MNSDGQQVENKECKPITIGLNAYSKPDRIEKYLKDSQLIQPFLVSFQEL